MCYNGYYTVGRNFCFISSYHVLFKNDVLNDIIVLLKTPIRTCNSTFLKCCPAGIVKGCRINIRILLS